MNPDDLIYLTLHCRRIFLTDYVVSIQIGAHAFERNQAQRVVFNVELFVPYTLSTSKDDQLCEVVDYDFIRLEITKKVREGHIELQETLCDELAAILFAHPHVQAVRLSSCKPDIYPDCAGVGVEVFRIKAIPQ